MPKTYSCVRETLAREIEQIDQPFVIATSGGVDSSALVATARALRCDVTIASFTLADRESRDFIAARRLATSWNIPFLRVTLPVDANAIADDVVTIIRRYGARKKTQVECLWPFLYVLDAMKSSGHTVLVTGSAADGHFGLSKRAIIHYRTPKERFQLFRAQYFSNPDAAQVQTLARVAESLGIRVVAPYMSPAVFELFADATHDELNNPRQKEPLRAAFPELDSFRLDKHTNLQLGDSGIAELVGETARLRFAPSAKSAVSAYNRIARR